MALTPPIIYADLAAARASGGFPFVGVNFDRMAWAIAYSVVSWLPTGTQLKGVSVGTAGIGAINVPVSKLFLAPNPALVITGLASAGMVGPLSVSLGTVVAQGLAKSVTVSGQYAGVVAGVGAGGDVSKMVATNGPALVALLAGNLAAMLGPGPASPQMAQGLGTGIASLFLTVTGTGNVIGPPSPSVATGQSTSVVV